MDSAPSAPQRAVRPLLVLQHVRYEPPAEYEAVLTERELPFDRVVMADGERLPDWRPYAGIVAMGGPMGADDHDAHPWLLAEKQLVRDAVAARTPFWGVCLGAQVLASALGGRVFAGVRPEVGMGDVTCTPDAVHDPVFCALPNPARVFQWHGDSFELPAGAQRLASSADYLNQAFRIGSAYGLQFHLEVTAELATQWLAIPEYARALEEALGADAASSMLSELHSSLPVTLPMARALFSSWLDAYIGPAGGRSGAAATVAGRTGG